MTLRSALLAVTIACALGVTPGLALAQADCSFPVLHPPGATCSGGPANGRPCYVFDAGDSFGCPGGTCIFAPGGGRAPSLRISYGQPKQQPTRSPA